MDQNKIFLVNARKGLRIRCLSVDDEIRTNVLHFGKWIKQYIKFPIRVAVYVKNVEKIKNANGELVYGTFFAPYDKKVEPYIKIAVGDFKKLKEDVGYTNALGAILHTFAHEIVHYEQWLNDKDLNERKARYRATQLVKKYLYDIYLKE